MLKKVLIANRGEIAVRVIRAARELGVRTVAAYSDADAGSLATKLADESVRIGPAPARESYLVHEAVIDAAKSTGAEAIHPGYGFLSENADFIRKVEKAGLVFVGPPSKAVTAMGDKTEAKRLARKAGVPVSPGSDGPIRDPTAAAKLAREIGLPVIVKAARGGGGRGQRVVWKEEELENAIEACRSEARSAFGSEDVFVEKFIESPRHIEFQILADSHGHVLHLGERECSIQRRNQKMIEEAPSNVLTREQRSEMGARVVDLARSVGYVNAGTMEFLWKDGQFYFMEMNTRLQVEHPVTELVTGIDLVRWQLRIAAGEPLTVKQEDVTFRGWAMEARVNAEDPWRGFAPAPGPVGAIRPPGGPGVRVDDYLLPGFTIPDAYDSLVAKVIAWGASRDVAVGRLSRALSEYDTGGLTTNIPFHLALLADEGFRKGAIHTNYLRDAGLLARFEAEAAEKDAEDRRVAAAVAAALAHEPGGLRAAEHRVKARRLAPGSGEPAASAWLLAARRGAVRGWRG